MGADRPAPVDHTTYRRVAAVRERATRVVSGPAPVFPMHRSFPLVALVGGPLDGSQIPEEHEGEDVLEFTVRGKVAVYVRSSEGPFIFVQGWSNFVNASAAGGAS